MKLTFDGIRKIGAGAALALALGATTAVAADVYKIGLAVPVTGGAADAGKREAIGATAAVKAINDAGGINGHMVEMFFADTGGNPQDAVNAVRKLTGDDNVLAIVGPHYSGVAEATFPLGNRLGIVQIAVASSKPGVAAANRPFAFRNTLTEVVNLDDPVTFQTGDAQFTAQITKLKAMNPDAIGLGALGPDALNIIGEARRQGMTQPFFGTAPLLEGNIPEKGGAGVAGTVAGTIWDNSLQDDRSEQFRAQYGEVAKTLYPGEFTARPDYYAVNAYDSVMMIKAAIEAQNIPAGDGDVEAARVAIKDFLTGLTTFDGVASNGFNDVGDGVKAVHVFEIVDGHWAPMQ
jgi:branched-chain amino acid transport system substrate-binding protein